MYTDEIFMRRAFDLAILGNGNVSPNPMVGAVLVYENKIIGEGWYQEDGGPHAEVNAVENVKEKDRSLIPFSTLYVSLEPCCIYGRTPPCTSLILEKKIPKVVISVIDKTPGVAGNGLDILRKKGVEVKTGILEKEGKKISQIRNHIVTKNRPYIILKFAKTKDGYIGKKGEQIWISNAFTKRLTHKWRSEVDAIIVGTNTARIDNPQLDNRLYFGSSPLRIVLDRNLDLPKDHHLLDDSLPTWIITEKEDSISKKINTTYHSVPFDDNLLITILDLLTKNGSTTLLVEGGAALLESFLKYNLWDEVRIFENNSMLHSGISAPNIENFEKTQSEEIMIMDNKLKLIIKNP